MDRRVVRVQITTTTEYDVVFDGDEPLFMGAFIPREASATGPNAGKLVDTHRTTWDGRGGGQAFHRHPKTGEPLGLRGEVIGKAQRALASNPELGRDGKIPAQLSKPYKWVQVGRK